MMARSPAAASIAAAVSALAGRAGYRSAPAMPPGHSPASISSVAVSSKPGAGEDDGGGSASRGPGDLVPIGSVDLDDDQHLLAVVHLDSQVNSSAAARN